MAERTNVGEQLQSVQQAVLAEEAANPMHTDPGQGQDEE